MAPTSTYRLQLREEFGFADAAAIVPYLARLGVSHVYCSPVLQAAPGSVHGYDVVDHSVLSEDLGGEPGWSRLVEACRAAGLGIIVDVVPNHMAMPTPESLNAALWQVLEQGQAAPTATWFDVDWEAGGGRILLPVLGGPFDAALEAGEVKLDFESGRVRYYDHEFPLAPGSLDGANPSGSDPGTVREILRRQHYRLADWREASSSLNYRRFFDVTTLLGVRVELPAVFRATHARLLELVAERAVDGLRIDHPDGLADPGGYLEQLAAASGSVWTVVEKILEPGETLPSRWACAGTTGYDALSAITNVFLDPADRPAADAIWRGLAPASLADWEDVVETSKRQVLAYTFRPEVDRLVGVAVAAEQPAGEDGEQRLRDALIELLVAFDVYRAYPEDLGPLAAAAQRATAARPDLADEIGRLQVLAAGEVASAAGQEFATRFGQTTGPVMAKGVEDTALYRFHRLTALNEVGGDPSVFGRPVEDFHAFCGRLQHDWPQTMTTLSTHDTKRSEDVRARLLVLAELSDEWAAAVAEWEAAVSAPGWPELDPPTRYLIWQTLVGAWPLLLDRLLGYLDKATREAKLHTSWTDRDPAYDAAVESFARRLYDDGRLLERVAGWVDEHVVVPGRMVALGQKLVQLTMPGIPDIYQGNEVTDLSLVDPDNRRPVDFAEHEQLLDDLAADTDGLESLAADTDGRAKLAVTSTALRLRRARSEAFAASYRPLGVEGPAADHLLAFARGDDVITLVTRRPVGLHAHGGWGSTAVSLPEGRWTDAVTGRVVETGAVATILDALPVALLAREQG